MNDDTKLFWLSKKIFYTSFWHNSTVAKYVGTDKPKLDYSITINNRLSRAGAQTYYDCIDKSYHIQIGKALINNYPKSLLIASIKHEIVHYLLMYYNVKNAKGNPVRAHGKEFKAILQSVHGIYYILSSFYNYNPSTPVYLFQCTKCGHIFGYKDYNAIQHYHCYCLGALKRLPIKTNLKTFLGVFLDNQYKHPCHTKKNMRRLGKALYNKATKQLVKIA